jgi:3-methyladenine DNA glycosylase AlkD
MKSVLKPAKTTRAKMSVDEVVAELRALGNPANVAGMAQFGIASTNTLGITIPALRAIAKRCGRDHALAAQLWATGIHEARILAGMVDDPAKVTPRQMDRWANQFDSWDVVDGVCGMFEQTRYAYDKAIEWSGHRKEYVKRAAFALIADIAVHDKQAPDEKILQFLPIIRREACDERNFVKKAVNWALRNIGKRNVRCNAAAIPVAEQIRADGTRAGRWIAADALRELRSEAVQRRLRAKR